MSPADTIREALPIEFGSADYWDIIEAALTSLPETNRLRVPALASFDHLKERVTAPADRHTTTPEEFGDLDPGDVKPPQRLTGEVPDRHTKDTP